MAITSPTDKFWWKEKISGPEVIWIVISLAWGILMFCAMIYWHIVGEQNLSNEAYRIDPEVFAAKTEAMAEKYKVREIGDTGIPVVHPPAGSDVYLLSRLWEWWPALELEKGQSYRLHLSSLDWQHGFSLQPTNINIQVHPDYEMVVTLTPTDAGEFSVVCNEFCGIGHHTMVGKIFVTDKK